MNKKELEKMFDYNFGHDNEDLPVIKQFIFETIIPEVLKSVMNDFKYKLNTYDDKELFIIRDGYNSCISDIKQKAKEFYNIPL